MSQTACSAQVSQDPPAAEACRTLKSVLEKPSLNHRSFHFRDAHMEHVLQPGGVLRRYVILGSSRLRSLLGQPKRREIEPLHAKQEQFELRTSELWEFAESEALRFLGLLYAKINKARAAQTPAPISEIEQAQAAETPARISAPRAPGKVLKPSPHEGDAHGILVQILPNGIDVLQQNGEVRRIVDLDITRALEASGAEVKDTIRVIRGHRHTVTIREERTGSHGEGQRTLRKGRTTYEIVREAGPPTHSRVEHPAADLSPPVQEPSEVVYGDRWAHRPDG